MYENKIFQLDALSNKLRNLKEVGTRIVMCHGVFDLVHPGHIKHFQAAKKEGDCLVVTVTSDQFASKGPGRPVFNEKLRVESLAAIEMVDYVAISNFPTAIDSIKKIEPDVYVKGDEYADPNNDLTGKISEEKDVVESVGGRIHFTSVETYSSSSLINSQIQLFSTATEEWLSKFRRNHSAEDILAGFDQISEWNALVIGEAIIDEYVFCDALGKSAKDPILAFKYGSIETYSGGSLAVANHMAGYLKNVGLITILGEQKSREDFIVDSLRDNVQAHLVMSPEVPTIHKRRFIDRHSGAKSFELYEMVDQPLSKEVEAKALQKIRQIIGDYDMVVVTDYGHGMLTPAIIELLVTEAKFLSVNTQANAGNRGFNTLTRYPRADYVSIAGNELELEIRAREQPMSDLLLELVDQIDCPRFTITLGKDGSLHYDRVTGFIEVPALAVKIVDRVGAGDAVLAVTTPLVLKNFSWDVVGFIGNLAGAEMVGHLGNRNYLDRVNMSKHVRALLK
jgi:rfaE bifunctional protein nucleotidyltransferase chain/domain